MTTQRFLIALFVLAASAATPAFASSCTNPCTGSSTTGADTTDRTHFNSDNSDLTFSNITFDNATGSYLLAGGLNATTSPTAQLYGAGFTGCLTSQSPCASNSNGLNVGTIAGWDGGTDPALLSTSAGPGPGQFDTITITLPAGVYAIAFDGINQNNYSSSAQFALNIGAGSEVYTAPTVMTPGGVFFGYRSATPINTVSIYTNYAYEELALDNFELGEQPAQTPEVATMLLVASGLFTIFYGHRRRRQALVPQMA